MYDVTVIVGRVGKDAEMRYTPDGKAVTAFSVAVDRGYGDKKKTEWFNVSAWDRLAEICQEYVVKGMLVLVNGTVNVDYWKDKDTGEAKGNLRVTARDVKFLSDGKGKRDNSEPDDSFGSAFS